MSYGFVINDSGGAPLVDSDDLGWNWIDSFQVAAENDGSITYSELPTDAVLAAHGVSTLTTGGGHSVTVSGRTVSWAHFHGSGLFINGTSPTVINVYMR